MSESNDIYWVEHTFEKCIKALVEIIKRLNRQSHQQLIAENKRLKRLAERLQNLAWYQRKIGMSAEQVELFYATLSSMHTGLCVSKNEKFHCGQCLDCIEKRKAAQKAKQQG